MDNRYRKDYQNDTSFHRNEDSYNEYLNAMKRVHRQSLIREVQPLDVMLSPRERHRKTESLKQSMVDKVSGVWSTVQQATQVSIIASMVPDEIIYKHSDHTLRNYETALMLIDVSGFTDLCEGYTKAGRGGPSSLTQVLNSYIGAMVQEILTHNGDVLKFSGDAFLSMWKKTNRLTMQDVVHTAIDCGLIVQRNYGTYVTDVGIVLKVKVTISAGMSYFSIIGGGNISQSHYVIIGQPVWDIKMAQYVSVAGDVITSASAWKYVNEAEYCTQPCGDGKHTKVLGVGATWKRVEKLDCTLGMSFNRDIESTTFLATTSKCDDDNLNEVNIREFSLRPSVVKAMRSNWWPALRRFMVTPVLRAVDNDEPMDFLTEVRRVVVVFVNIITKIVTEGVLIEVVNKAYKSVCSVASESGGLVNKVSMFDKDMTFLVVFGLRGLKHEDEAQKALQCAFQLKENLNDHNIISVSIGVTSGTTYCGVVGHVLRREYTVIGTAVNKAARLMIAYPNKVTCDKETFLRSKLNQEFFRLMEAKPLKGIALPGPIYEFIKLGWSERQVPWRHPLLGRSEELQKYKMVLLNAMKQRHKKFTRYRDHKYAIAIIGPKMVGKSRLMEECLYITPKFIHVERITMTAKDKVPFGLIRLIMFKPFIVENARTLRENCEDKIRCSVDIMSMTPLQLYGINTIFDCRFPLPEKFTYTGDLLAESCVKDVIEEICKNNFLSIWIVAVKGADFTDDASWRVLLMVLDTKTIFVLMTFTEENKLSLVAQACLSSDMIVKITLSGIDRWYHAALACQLLDVQAIPADLEKVIQSASGGMAGWIQNFVISLVQRGQLTIVTVNRSEAMESGAVLPPRALLQRTDDDVSLQLKDPHSWTYDEKVNDTVSMNVRKQANLFTEQDSDTIQMAVLAEMYNFDDMKVDMTMDAIILKTYDSLTPFEKMILKCSSVLGDVFSRRMLLHLLQSDSPRKVAEAVAKLFTIRVLECEGGDFTRDTSLVLVHPAPALPGAKPPYCACLGIRHPSNCRDLPMYAFCGYMKFKHSLFRTTTYELLTENQKRELHARTLLYLERYTRRCISCGGGCFITLLGQRINDGLTHESEELKHTREQISALSAEVRLAGEQGNNISTFVTETQSEITVNLPIRDHSSYELLESEEMRHLRQSQSYSKNKYIRSFSSLELINCECLPILLSVYCQIIDHCRGAGENEKLFEAYLEYADLSVINLNIPQAIRLLFEVENVVMNENIESNYLYEIKWIKDYRLARIYSLRGACMLESGDTNEARKQLLLAMKLYSDPFPSTKHSVRLQDWRATFHQIMAFYVVPTLYVARNEGNSLVGQFYEDIAKNLNRLCRLFSECKEINSATLAAKLSLHYALRTDSNFRLLCVSYGNMITTYRQKRNFSLCKKLEKRAMELCHRKRGQLDVTEVHAVCFLYTSIFLFYVEYGKKLESLEFGLSVMHMMTNLTDLTTRQMLVLWMLKLLLSEIRINDMVSIMREFFYMSDHYDLSSETWYYFYAMVILLDTGYCVESYRSSEKFYIKKGNAILRSKTPEAAWNFFVCMCTIRVGAWERSILWEDKIKKILSMKFEKHEFSIMILIRLVEGLLITLVKEMDNRNIKNILSLEKIVKTMFQDIKNICSHAPMYRPRYYLLFAYYHYIRGKRLQAYSYLNKACDLSKQYAHSTVLIWAEHTRNENKVVCQALVTGIDVAHLYFLIEKHWKGTLSPMLEDYWAEHIEPDNLLDYREFGVDKGKQIIPYTLPVPRDLSEKHSASIPRDL